jgi:hypothetical protein
MSNPFQEYGRELLPDLARGCDSEDPAEAFFALSAFLDHYQDGPQLLLDALAQMPWLKPVVIGATARDRELERLSDLVERFKQRGDRAALKKAAARERMPVATLKQRLRRARRRQGR